MILQLVLAGEYQFIQGHERLGDFLAERSERDSTHTEIGKRNSRFASRREGKCKVKMTSILLLRGVESSIKDRYPLDPAADEALSAASRELVSFATAAEQGAIAHERDGEIVAAWTHEGALRLAQLLPPAYTELANTIREHHQAEP